MSLKQKLGPVPYRFIQSSNDRLQVKFSKDHLKEVTAKQASSYSLEVIKEGQIGVAVQNQLDLDRLIDKALISAEYGEAVSYLYPQSQKVKDNPKLYSDKIVDLTPETLISTGQQMIQQLKDYNANILVDVSFTKSVSHGSLETSSQIDHHQSTTSYSGYLEGELVQTGDILQIGEFWGWRDLTIDHPQMVQKLIQKFKWAEKITNIKSGIYPVIFMPDALSTVLDFIFEASSGKNVEKKVSRWTDQLGQVVMDSRISMVDDPTIDYAIDSTMLDDQGYPSQILPIIDQGKLVNFYHDLNTAQKVNQEPNGRGFGVPAHPGLTNVRISTGQLTTEQLIKNIKHGVIVEQVIGGGQDSPYAGDFSLNIHLGYLIEDGQIVGRIKDCLISGNIFEMLKSQLIDISSDAEWYGGSLQIAPMAFEKMTITGNK